MNATILRAPVVIPVESADLGFADAVFNEELDGYTLDFTAPATTDSAIRWLYARGHDAGWMRAASVGGKVPAWDGLTDEEVSAILVSVSVARVAAGGRPVEGYVSMLTTELNFEATQERPAKTFHMVVFNTGPTHDDRYRNMAFDTHAEAQEVLHKMKLAVVSVLNNVALLVPGGVMVRL